MLTKEDGEAYARDQDAKNAAARVAELADRAARDHDGLRATLLGQRTEGNDICLGYVWGRDLGGAVAFAVDHVSGAVEVNWRVVEQLATSGGQALAKLMLAVRDGTARELRPDAYPPPGRPPESDLGAAAGMLQK